jgi:hypothetical protein
MQAIQRKVLTENLTAIVEENISLVKSELTELTEEQLNWRPSQDSWSIREILAHLNSYSIYYQNTMEIKIE